MALRMRRSINLGGGVRMNVSKRSVGLSAGVRGARYSVNSSGRRTRTVGIPGTGISHVSTSSGRSTRSRSERQTAVAAPAPPKPGMFAPKHEKEFHKGIQQLAAGEPGQAFSHFEAAAAADAKDRAIADELMSGLAAVQLKRAADAIPYLEAVVGSDTELPDELLLKYAPGMAVTIGITEAVSVTLPVGSYAAALALVECYQEVGRSEEAVGLLQRLVETDEEPALKLSLCEVYAELGEWDEIVALAAGASNEDDVTLQLRLYQAKALIERGQDEVALEVYRDTLRSKRRDAELLKEARYGRGSTYLRLGKKAQGRKDLAAVYADDPSYADVAELLKDGS